MVEIFKNVTATDEIRHWINEFAGTNVEKRSARQEAQLLVSKRDDLSSFQIAEIAVRRA